MNDLITSHLLDALRNYCTDRMLAPSFRDVRRRFLPMVGKQQITGMPYVVLCLLLAQSMRNMMLGYGGHSSGDDRFLHEAVGVCLAFDAQHNNLAGELPRYAELVKVISSLQTENRAFGALVNQLLGEDLKGNVQ